MFICINKDVQIFIKMSIHVEVKNNVFEKSIYLRVIVHLHEYAKVAYLFIERRK